MWMMFMSVVDPERSFRVGDYTEVIGVIQFYSRFGKAKEVTDK